jgi:hypothetical protein
MLRLAWIDVVAFDFCFLYQRTIAVALSSVI